MERQSTSKLFRTVIAVLAFFALCMSALLFAACDKGTSAHTHTYSETAITTSAATCGAPGSVTYECTVCHERYSVVVSLATGAHDFDSNGRCTVCGLSEDEAGLTVQALRSTLQVELNDLSSRLALLEQLKDVQDTLGGRIANYSEKVQQLQEALTESQAALGQNINSANGGIDQLARNFDALYAGIFGESLNTAAEGFTRPTALNALLNYIAQGLENVLGSGKDNDLTDEELASLQDVYNGVTEFQASLEEFGTTLTSINTTITTSIKSVTDILGTFTTPERTVASMLEAILAAVQGGEETAPHAHTVHSFILQPVEGKGASCTTPGLYQYVCAIEGCTVTAGEQISLPALGHTYDWTKAKTAANSVEAVNGVVKTDHYTSATCIAPERVEGWCSVCGATEEANGWTGDWKEYGTPTYKHLYTVDHTLSKASSCNEYGYIVYHCETCGGAFVETDGEARDHNYYINLDTGAELTDSEKEALYLEYLGITADDEEKDAKLEAMTDQQRYDALIDNLNIVSQASASCTTPGLVVVECAHCGVRYAYSYGEPNGHTWHEVDAKDYSDYVDICTLGVLNGTNVHVYHCDACGHFIIASAEGADATARENALNGVQEDSTRKQTAYTFTTNYVKNGRRAVTFIGTETSSDEWTEVLGTVIALGTYEDGTGKVINVRTEPEGHHFPDLTTDKATLDMYRVTVSAGDCEQPMIAFYVCKVCGLALKEDGTPKDPVSEHEATKLYTDDNHEVNLAVDPEEFRARLFPANGKKFSWYFAQKQEGIDWTPKYGYLIDETVYGEQNADGTENHAKYARQLGEWLGYPTTDGVYDEDTDAFKAWAESLKIGDETLPNLVKELISVDYDRAEQLVPNLPAKETYDYYRYLLATNFTYFGLNISGWTRTDDAHKWVVPLKDTVDCVADPILTALFDAWYNDGTAEGTITTSEWYTGTDTDLKWVDGIVDKIKATTAFKDATISLNKELTVLSVKFGDNKARTYAIAETNYKAAIDFLASEDAPAIEGLDEAFIAGATTYGVSNLCYNKTCPMHSATEYARGGRYDADHLDANGNAAYTASWRASVDHIHMFYVYQKANDGDFVGSVADSKAAVNGIAFSMEEDVENWISEDGVYSLYLLQYYYDTVVLHKATDAAKEAKLADFEAKLTEWKLTAEDLFVLDEEGTFTCRVAEHCSTCGMKFQGGAHIKPTNENGGAMDKATCWHADRCVACGKEVWDNKTTDHKLVSLVDIFTDEVNYGKLWEQAWAFAKEMELTTKDYDAETIAEDAAALLDELLAKCYEDGEEWYVCTGCLEARLDSVTNERFIKDWVEFTTTGAEEDGPTTEELTTAWNALTVEGEAHLSKAPYNYYHFGVEANTGDHEHVFKLNATNKELVMAELARQGVTFEEDEVGLEEIAQAVLKFFNADYNAETDELETVLTGTKDQAHTELQINGTDAEGYTFTLYTVSERLPSECYGDNYSIDYCFVCALHTYGADETETKNDIEGKTGYTVDKTSRKDAEEENELYASEGKYDITPAAIHIWAPMANYWDNSNYENNGVDVKMGFICVRCYDEHPNDAKTTMWYWAQANAGTANIMKDEDVQTLINTGSVTITETYRGTLEEGSVELTYDPANRPISALRRPTDIITTVSADTPIEEAFAGLEDGGTVALADDVEFSTEGGTYINFVEGVDNTLNLNQKTLTIKYTENEVTAGNLSIEANDIVTIKNGTLVIDGATTKISDHVAPGVIVWEGGKLVLDNVTLTSKSQGAALSVRGEATITGSTIISTTNTDEGGRGIEVGNHSKNAKLTISNSTVIAAPADVAEATESAHGIGLVILSGTVEADTVTFIGIAGAFYAQSDSGNPIDISLTSCTFKVGLYDAEKKTVDTAKVATNNSNGAIAAMAQQKITIKLAGTTTFDVGADVKKVFLYNTQTSAENLVVTCPAADAANIEVYEESNSVTVNGAVKSHE